MARVGNYVVGGSVLMQPQAFAQAAFFDVLGKMALRALASGIRYVKKDAFMPDTAGFTETQLFDAYSPYVANFGSPDAQSALAKGEQVLVALRIETNTRSNQGHGVYDDRLAVIWQVKVGNVRAAEVDAVKHGKDFKMNTEPSAQYESREPVEVEKVVKIKGKEVKRKVKEFAKIVDPDGNEVAIGAGAKGVGNDVNQDNRLAAGRLKSGTYKFYNSGGKFLGAAFLIPREIQSAQRDVNHDGLFTNADTWTTPEGQLAIDVGNHGMFIHRGADDNTWSAGCQTLPPNEHAILFQTLNSKQKDFNYVLVDI